MILKGVIENEKCGHRISDGMRMEENPIHILLLISDALSNTLCNGCIQSINVSQHVVFTSIWIGSHQLHVRQQ